MSADCPAATWTVVDMPSHEGPLPRGAADIVRCTFLDGHDGPHADGRGHCWANWSPEFAGYIEVRRG